jgi:hypothetical protein
MDIGAITERLTNFTTRRASGAVGGWRDREADSPKYERFVTLANEGAKEIGSIWARSGAPVTTCPADFAKEMDRLATR